MKMSKIITTIIVLLILIILICFGTKFYKVNKIIGNMKKTMEIANAKYTVESISMTTYILNNKTVIDLGDVKWYINFDNTNYIVDTVNKTYTQINELEDMTTNALIIPEENFVNLTFIDKIKLVFKWDIKTEECQGVKVYALQLSDNEIYYIDKENGYVIATQIDDVYAEITNIEFNIVTEENMTILDLTEYTYKT